ncbi:MAG TPA: DUF3221 domain-containing protein [Longimicrobiaceae bacterium]|nr:DUF3221 domain-containing protein [Longimicrobiaceae bacterium]
MNSRFSILALALACAAPAACSRAAVLDPAPGDAYVRGPVEAVTHHATASRLLVRAGPGSREPCGISATVDRRTRYLRREPSGTLGQTDRSALSVGDTVEVHVDGAVAESCPVQARASFVVLVASP